MESRLKAGPSVDGSGRKVSAKTVTKKKTQSRASFHLFRDNEKGHCRLCEREDDEDDMVSCDECDRWFHLSCVNLKRMPSPAEEWSCIKCQTDRGQLPSTSDAGQQGLAMLELVKVLQQTTLQGNLQLKRTTLTNLPYFDGKPKDWPRFKKAFDETTKEAKFSPLENLNRLQRFLKGEAERSVRSLFLDPENISAIMLRLEEQFGRPDQVYQEMLKDVMKVRVDSQFKIPELSDALENLVTNLKVMGKFEYLRDHRLIDELVGKLSTDKQIGWLQYKAVLEGDHTVATLEDLSNWLLPSANNLRQLVKKNDRSRNTVNLHKQNKNRKSVTTSKRLTSPREALSESSGDRKDVAFKIPLPANNLDKQQQRPPRSPAKQQQRWTTFGNPAQHHPCPACQGSHPLHQCVKFKKAVAEERYAIATKGRVCLSCLASTDHHMKVCTSSKQCGILQCTSKHHPLLHEAFVANHQQAERQVYFQIVPVTLRNGNKTLSTFAFLDPGSSLTLLEETTAKHLNLQGKRDPLSMTWTQDLSVHHSNSRRVQCVIKGATEESEYALSGVRTVENLQLPQQSIDASRFVRTYSHLKGLNIKPFINGCPTLLIGLNNSNLLIPLDRKMGKINEPMAIQTKLGWLIFGVECKYPASETEHIMMHNEAAMNDMMRQYFSTEDFGVKVTKVLKSTDEEQARNIVSATMKRTDGRYEVGLLWKQQPMFPLSQHNAMNRLVSLEKQLMRNPELRTWAEETFRKYEEKGYLRKLTPQEAAQRSSKTFYLPHFIVVNKNKPVPKPRLVFDAAAKVNGVSLNSMLLSGPDEMASLFGVLVRFREGNICVTGDIQEMFHQVKIRKDDQDAQRILWRNCESRVPDTYVMQVMTFGATCSPACAQLVKNHNAVEHEETHKLAVQPIIRQHYVDDYLDSFFSMEKAIDTVRQVIDVHRHGGFHIRNFKSNKGELLSTIPDDRQEKSNTVVEFEDKDSAYEKVLGVQWNATTDLFTFKVNFGAINPAKRPTKREVLSFVMSVYDPLGLISYITIHGRILMQAVHTASEDWDVPIPEYLQPAWDDWLKMVERAGHVKIPRQMLASPDGKLELHTFVDASEDAFAACVYARSVSESSCKIRLVVGKARVAPIKALSIPRLELQAAVLGARLTETVKNEMRVPVIKVTYWSDSQTVLAWINSRHRKYHQFVSHRVSEILDTSSSSQWRWVPTKENPADIATKPASDERPWFNGPAFLHGDETEWPVSKVIPATAEEIRVVAVHQPTKAILPEENYSSWQRLLRHTTYLKKFIDFLQDRKTFSRIISPEDVNTARNALYRKVQWEGFPEEMAALTKGNIVSRQSRLNKLMPYLDDMGIMRSRSRLENVTSIPESARLPIILPQKPRIVKLIVRNCHETKLHQADNVVVAELRQKYWILQARVVLRNVKNCCQKCILRTTTPKAPLMAPLPEFRAHPYQPPFLHTGVDYFGPINVAVRRSTEKRWGVMFTCLSTRAVHLEVAEKLDTDSFLVCLKNFQYRRGKVAYLYSDNGTNFIGAEKELKQLVLDIDRRMGKEAALQYDIKWTFNPPAAPHFGGSWERLIQSVKKALRHLFTEWSNRNPTPETLRSTLVQIEGMMNSRPLTHIPVNNEEDEILTPFHFLIGRGIDCVPPVTDETSLVGRKQWKLVQHSAKIYWDRWKKEYLPTLSKRNKWTDKVEPLKEGDIVVLTDDNAAPGKWSKGRIVKVNTAPDEQVRSVEILVGNGIIKRPAVKVAVVDVTPKEHLLHSRTKKRVPPKRQMTEVPAAVADPEVIQPPRKRRIAPCLWAQKLLLATTILSIMCSPITGDVQPVEEGGIVFSHLGSCFVQQGTLTTRFETDIHPIKDIGRMHHLRHQLSALYDKIKDPQSDDHTLADAVALIREQAVDTEREIWFTARGGRRVKRSGGLLGLVKGMLLGGDEVEDELHRIQTIEAVKNKQLFGALNTVSDKTIQLGNQFINRTEALHSEIDSANNEVKRALVRVRMMEHTLFAHQVIESISNKYRMLRTEPVPPLDLSKVYAEMEGKLSPDVVLLKQNSDIKVQEEANRLVISITCALVQVEVYEVFRAYPVPDIRAGTIITLEYDMIAANEKQQHFIPRDLEKVNSTHFIATQPILDSQETCVSGKLFNPESHTNCVTGAIKKPYARLIHMHESNAVLYYVDNLKRINLTCKGDNVKLVSKAAVVNLDYGCTLRTDQQEVKSMMTSEPRSKLYFSKLSIREPAALAVRLEEIHVTGTELAYIILVIMIIAIGAIAGTIVYVKKLKGSDVADERGSNNEVELSVVSVTECTPTAPPRKRLMPPFRPRKCVIQGLDYEGENVA